MKEVLIVGSGNLTSIHLINYLLEEKVSVRAIYRKTSPPIDSGRLVKIQGDVSVDSVSGWAQGCDAVVYMAGGDPSQEDAVEHLGAKKLVDSAEINGAQRFIYVSALGAHDPNSWGSEFRDYLLAKASGEAAVKASSLSWTIVRPGILNNGPSVGKIATKADANTDLNVSRQDVALTIALSLKDPNTFLKTFDIVSGDISIGNALARLR